MGCEASIPTWAGARPVLEPCPQKNESVFRIELDVSDFEQVCAFVYLGKSRVNVVQCGLE